MSKAKSTSVCMPRDEYASVSVRKIDNGFIVSKSTSGPKGYKSSETFSPTKPKLDIPLAKPAPKAKAMPDERYAVPINFDPLPDSVNVGDRFTISGLKVVAPGQFITNCTPGEETLMVASQSAAAFRIRKDRE